MPRAAVEARRGPAMHVVVDTVASNGGAHIFDPLRFFCDDEFCYPTHGRTVMFSDPQHLTAAGSPLLEADLLDDLRWLLHEGGGRQQADEPRGLHSEHLAVRAAEVRRAGEPGADAGLGEAGALLH